MSYNVSVWTTKRIENLVIPLSALCNIDNAVSGWKLAPPIITGITNGISLEIGGFGEGRAKGKLLSGNEFSPNTPSTNIFICEIAISEISVWGEGSGTFHDEILLPALRQSRGVLEAVLVWEGGDSISRLIAEDGEVTETHIEL